jgi:phage protein D
MVDTAATSALYTARPNVKLDGQEEAALTEGLLSLLVEETSGGVSRCEAVLGNWGSVSGAPDYLYFDRQLLDFGKSFAITAGDGDTAAQLFDGRIMGLEAGFPQASPPELTVLAEGRFQDLRMTRRTRTFEDETDQRIFERVAGEHGLGSDIDVDGPTHRALAQVNQSDLAFLRERARAVDAELWVDGDTLFAVARTRLDRGEVELTYGQNLRELSVLADLAGQCTSLTVSGWDVSAKEGIEYEATESAISGELNGDDGGATILNQALGDRAEHVVHTVPFDQSEAQSLAEARFRRIARRFVSGRGLAEGDGRLRVGTRLKVSNVGAMFDGTYAVVEVRHIFDPVRGFLSQFTVERPGIGSG